MSSDPTDLIREASETLDGITPGPWALHDRGIGVEVHAPNGADSVDPNGTHCLTDDDVFDERYAPRSMANAVFIANAPTLVRRLRDALEATAGDACGTCLAIAREARKDASLFENLYDEARAALAEANATIAALREREETAGHIADVEMFKAVEATAELVKSQETIERVRALADEWGAGIGGTVAALALRRAIEGPQS